MWLKNFVNELKAWIIIRRVYRHNKRDFDAVGLKSDWFGKLYKVINRDPSIELGSGEDEVYLRKETAEIWGVLVKHNIVDMLAYELTPLEDETIIEVNGEKKIEFEHGYYILFTPAWNLDKQYVTTKSVLTVLISLIAFIIFICSLIASNID